MRLLATLLVIVGLSGCGGSEPAAPTAASPTAASSSPVATPSPSPSPTPEGSALTAVQALVRVIGSDMPAAWSLLTSRSQAGFGSYDAFAELQTEYAEGLAAFDGAQPTSLPLGADRAVVTLSGDISREGETERDAFTTPARVEDGAWKVELGWVGPDAPMIEIEAPLHAATRQSGQEMRAIVPAAAQTTVWLDGAQQQTSETPADGDRTAVTLSPQLGAGEHVLTVAVVRADGLLLAESVVFRVR